MTSVTDKLYIRFSSDLLNILKTNTDYAQKSKLNILDSNLSDKFHKKLNVVDPYYEVCEISSGDSQVSEIVKEKINSFKRWYTPVHRFIDLFRSGWTGKSVGMKTDLEGHYAHGINIDAINRYVDAALNKFIDGVADQDIQSEAQLLKQVMQSIDWADVLAKSQDKLDDFFRFDIYFEDRYNICFGTVAFGMKKQLSDKKDLAVKFQSQCALRF
jgi:hypothetical protein